MKAPVIYIMGVSGSGKTTIGQLLAKQLSLPFFDADDFHPDSNILKMSQGIPLDDTDRQPWLKKLNQLAKQEAQKKGAVITSSALKEHYRQTLAKGLLPAPYWVHLFGEQAIISNRIKQRKGHFMPASLLKSQYQTLEKPTYGLEVPIEKSPEEQVQKIVEWLANRWSFPRS